MEKSYVLYIILVQCNHGYIWKENYSEEIFKNIYPSKCVKNVYYT